MNSLEIREQAETLLKRNQLQCLTLEAVQKIIQAQGFTIISFNNLSNAPDVTTLINSLNLKDTVQRSKGFTYADRNFRLVFVHEGLTNDEKLLVLAHEEGHIFLNHLGHNPILGIDICEEHEADEFARFAISPSALYRMYAWVRTHRGPILLSMIVVVAIAVGVAFIARTEAQKTQNSSYYITETGTKYHRKECIFIKGKSNTKILTREQIKSGNYAPCDVCLPDK